MSTTESKSIDAPTVADSAVTVISWLDERSEVQVPTSLRSLADFRAWIHSDAAPQRGRIDFIAGRIELDMSPEDLSCHNVLKATIAFELFHWNKSETKGHVFVDGALVVAPAASLAAEPDVVYTSFESIDAGRARLVPKANAAAGRFVELEGAPDLAVEVVSDSSVAKDRRRLFAAYFAAGVGEYWIVDARGDELVFVVHHRGESDFVPAAVDGKGFQPSRVLARRVKLTRTWNDRGWWDFKFEIVL